MPLNLRGLHDELNLIMQPEDIIDQATLEQIRTTLLNPEAQELLAAHLTASQVGEIVNKLPDEIRKNPKVKVTLPWIKILRLDGKKLVRWSRSSQELKGVFEEVTNQAFKTMPESEIRSLIHDLPPEVKQELASLLSHQSV